MLSAVQYVFSAVLYICHISWYLITSTYWLGGVVRIGSYPSSLTSLEIFTLSIRRERSSSIRWFAGSFRMALLDRVTGRSSAVIFFLPRVRLVGPMGAFVIRGSSSLRVFLARLLDLTFFLLDDT